MITAMILAERTRGNRGHLRSAGIIHVPISMYVLTSSQTPSSSPFDEEHDMLGAQAVYVVAIPMTGHVNSGMDVFRACDRTDVTGQQGQHPHSIQPRPKS